MRFWFSHFSVHFRVPSSRLFLVFFFLCGGSKSRIDWLNHHALSLECAPTISIFSVLLSVWCLTYHCALKAQHCRCNYEVCMFLFFSYIIFALWKCLIYLETTRMTLSISSEAQKLIDWHNIRKIRYTVKWHTFNFRI